MHSSSAVLHSTSSQFALIVSAHQYTPMKNAISLDHGKIIFSNLLRIERKNLMLLNSKTVEMNVFQVRIRLYAICCDWMFLTKVQCDTLMRFFLAFNKIVLVRNLIQKCCKAELIITFLECKIIRWNILYFMQGTLVAWQATVGKSRGRNYLPLSAGFWRLRLTFLFARLDIPTSDGHAAQR